MKPIEKSVEIEFNEFEKKEVKGKISSTINKNWKARKMFQSSNVQIFERVNDNSYLISGRWSQTNATSNS